MHYLTWHKDFPFPGTKEYEEAYTKRWGLSPGVMGGLSAMPVARFLSKL